MADKIEYSRMLVKRTAQTGEVPTIPPITAVTLNQMIPTDLFVGEFYLNEADDLLWIRTDNGILPISLSGSTGTTNPNLTEVLFEGNATNGYDIEISVGDTIVWNGLSTGASVSYLAVDASGNTISSPGVGGSNLATTLGLGNNTGANNIVFPAGQKSIGDLGYGFFEPQASDNSVNMGYVTTGATGGFGISDTALTANFYNGSQSSDIASDGNFIKMGNSGAGYFKSQNIGATSGMTIGISVGSKLFIENLTSGVTDTFLVIDPDTKQVTYQSGGGGSGTNGSSGTSGSSGSSGTSGASGSSGSSGSSGTSGSSGSNGEAGSSGSSGSSGTSGTRGDAGTSGTSGTSGSNGEAGSSGTSGANGTSGSNGSSGTNGANGTSGTNGAAGSSGTSGIGTSGTSGLSGVNGTNGSSGNSGSSGTSGTGGGGSLSGSHFNWTLTPDVTYDLAITAQYEQIGIEANSIWAFPFTPGRNVTISAMTIDIFTSAASAACKILAYNHNLSANTPGSVIIESTSFDLSSAGIKQYNVNYTFSAGTTYWFAIASNTEAGGIQMRGISQYASFPFGVPGSTGLGIIYNLARSYTLTYPTIPSTFTLNDFNNARIHEIRFKAS